MPSLLAAVLLFVPTAPADLNRVFSAGEKHSYEFNSRVSVDYRQAPLQTFIPETVNFTYTFTTAVEQMKPDGVADLRFKRPKILLKEGETFDSPPKTEAVIQGENYLYTISRKNQMLGVKDFTPRPKPKGDGGGLMLRSSTLGGSAQLDIGGWIGQLRQIAAYVNFFDMGPILPDSPVNVGGTWKDTIGYVPATIPAGADKGKSINARIDYVMTYMGAATLDGMNTVHIQGKITQDSDAAPYIAQLLGVKLERAPFKEIHLKMDGLVDYYLDPKTLDPVQIKATSEGSVDVSVPDYSGGPVYEERFKSRASLVRK
ncbi:MAG TPA: hypothetical protein VFG65_04045 [Fimbriimonadales bacterium]|jgi:hypothetical protein|nr:hypothetical protein [Fimbriimonadales bacterium]